jgi:hypothetical protein
MKDWIEVVWNRRLRVLLRKQGMLVLDAFKGHIMLNAGSVIHALNTHLVVIPGGMTS